MSTRYNTGNPIESTDVRDMSDNAKNLDLFSNSSELSFDDRFGVERKTIHGMNSEFDGMIVGMNSEFDAQILNMGFTRVGTFLSGATLTNPRQTLLWDIADGGDGQEYGWSGTFAPHGKIVPPSSSPTSTGGVAIGAWASRFDPLAKTQIREALRRSYAEAGYNLVDGSFEAGGTLVNANDVLLQERTGKAFSGPAGTVAAGTNPASGGFVDKSGLATSASAISNANGGSVQDFIDYPIIQGEAAPAYNIQLTNHDSESTDRRIIAIIDRVLYADSSTALYQSLDMGDTWQLVRSKAGRWLKMLKCSDGEILIISGGTDVQKSSGWATNRATATFSTVLTFPVNTGVLRWSIDGDGTKFICTHYENGGTRADVRYAYISTNSGNTWNLVWDSVARFGATDANLSHLHAVCYDQRNDRFWICEGHIDLGVFYSENDGSTWTRFDDQGFYTKSTPTTMTPTPYGIVAGTDTFPNGIHLIKGDLASALKPEVAYIYRSNGAGTQLQADAAVTDPNTGLVYIAARGFASPAKSVIMCSNGETASLIYESETNDAIFNLAVMDGKLIAHQSGTPYKTIKGRVSTIGSKQPLFDAGNIVTENIVPNLSIAIGKGSDAQSLNSMALGRNTKVGTVGGQDLIAEGPNNVIEGGSKNIVVGGNNNLTGTTANTVCYSWGVTLANLSNVCILGIGANTTASNTTTYGANSLTEGANSTTIGVGARSKAGNAASYGFNSVAALLSCAFGSECSVDVTGGSGFGYDVTIGGSNGSGFGRGATVNTGITNGTAVGALSIVAHANAVAIGVSTVTQRTNSVCVGERDIESTKTAGRVLLKSPDGTLYALAVANGGTLSITAV